MRLSPLIVWPVIYAAIGFFWFYRVYRFLKASRAVLSKKPGEGLLVETPLGSVDLHSHDGSDPELASIPKYPGAIPLKPDSHSYEAALRFGNRQGRYLAQNDWTADPMPIVTGYYEREFPQWKRDYIDDGWRCCQPGPGCTRTITIKRERDRTMLEYSVLYQKEPALSQAGRS